LELFGKMGKSFKEYGFRTGCLLYPASCYNLQRLCERQIGAKDGIELVLDEAIPPKKVPEAIQFFLDSHRTECPIGHFLDEPQRD